ncbi:MAG: hypothetical protein ABR991_00800 [Terracidiphilus sp.]
MSATQLNATANAPGTFVYTPSLGAVPSAGSQTLSVTFTPADTTLYAPVTTSVALTVIPTPTSVSWSAPAAIPYGTALSAAQLNAAGSVPGTFAYSPSIGAVLPAGLQTLSVVFTPANTNYATSTASVTLSVNQATPVLNWKTPVAIPYGAALSAAQLNATASVPGSFTYSPSSSTELSLGAHLLSVIFTPADSTDYTTAAASVTIIVIQATPQISWATPAPISYGAALSATQLDAAANVPGSFVYAQSSGTVFSAGPHTLSVTFTPTDTTDYTTAAASVTLTVNQAIPVLSWTAPPAITYGTALSAMQLDATANVAGTFAYTPALGTVLKSGSGQTLSVTFTPTDTADYAAPAAATTTITVNQATPTITWATPAAITYGSALSATQLDATANVTGTFVYTPALGTVLKSGSGQTLSVTFTPTDTTDYATTMATVQLAVNQATPTITWTTPAAITYGTALSGTQLNASSSVPGTFTYSPASGAVLTAGPQMLSVTLTPADATDYTSAKASVQLTVNQATPQISWATPAPIFYGTALSAMQLNASSVIAGTFAYSPASGAVLTAGKQTLSLTFTPSDSTDYTAAAASVTLTVNPATPTIQWTPRSLWIAVGTPLSTSQLNATATSSDDPVTGTFNYSPAAGTSFNSPGLQKLSVTFTPADTADYTTSTDSISMTVASFGVVAWGDSLTFGNEGYSDVGNYPADLESLITLPVVNMGVSGQTSTQVAVREGGVPTYAAADSGVIPASGGVTVTFPTGYEPVNADGPAGGVAGAITNVHGTVTYDSASSVYTFTRTDSGSPVSAPGTGIGAPQFVVDTPYANYIPVIWVGRNNTGAPKQILSDIAAMVATIPDGQDYLILSDTNDNAMDEWLGGSSYLLVTNTNTQLAALYPAHYLDIRKVLVNSYNDQLITDVSDFQHDEPPTSLREAGVQTTLANSVAVTDTTITLVSTHDIGADWILTLDPGTPNAENVLVSSVSGTTVTVVRNYGGVQTAHNAGASVDSTQAVHFNAQGAQIEAEAIANYLSAYAK